MMKDITQLLTKLDSNKECDVLGHQFCCADAQGTRGELVMINKVLSEDEISQLTKNPALAQKICPNGKIFCSRCHVSLSGEKSANPPLPVIKRQDFFK